MTNSPRELVEVVVRYGPSIVTDPFFRGVPSASFTTRPLRPAGNWNDPGPLVPVPTGRFAAILL